MRWHLGIRMYVVYVIIIQTLRARTMDSKSQISKAGKLCFVNSSLWNMNWYMQQLTGYQMLATL